MLPRHPPQPALLLALPLLVLAAGCPPKPTGDTAAPVDTGDGPSADADGDGYVRDDCDDTNPQVHPGAEETCNGRDDDCDGASDEADATDATPWYDDEDGDGFGAIGASTLACDAPTGTVADGTDCDDTSAAIRPGADEVVEDGVDQDCDGQDLTCEAAGGYAGDVYVASEEDAAGLCASFTRVCGALAVVGELGDDLSSLACLASVEGDLAISADSLARVVLPALERVGGNVTLVGLQLDSLSLPVLATVGGDLVLETVQVGVADLDALARVGGGVRLEAGVGPSALSLPALASLPGGLTLERGSGLTGVDAASLAEAGGLEVRDVADLSTLDLPALRRLDGPLSLARADGIRTLEGLPVLSETGDLLLQENARLEDLEGLSGLTHVAGDLTIVGNPRLSTDEVDAFLDALGTTHVDGTVTVEGNGG